MPTSPRSSRPSWPATPTDPAVWEHAVRTKNLAAVKRWVAHLTGTVPCWSEAGGFASPLQAAIENGWWPGFVMLLPVSDTSFTNTQGNTPLLQALSSATPTRHARAMGAQLIPLSDVNAVGRQGVTPLGEAVVRGDLTLVDRLLTAGADPRKPSGGQSLLFTAWSPGVPNVLHDRLLPLIDPTFVNGQGNTLLHELIRLGDLTPTAFTRRWLGLVQRGVDPYQPNALGMDDGALSVLSKRSPDLFARVRRSMVQHEVNALTEAMSTPGQDPLPRRRPNVRL